MYKRLDLAYVASGRVDGYVELSLKPWDFGAGELIALEAGA
ncbi:inositol monophosphatase family protein, partial [Enterobacter sichuanensis]